MAAPKFEDTSPVSQNGQTNVPSFDDTFPSDSVVAKTETGETKVELSPYLQDRAKQGFSLFASFPGQIWDAYANTIRGTAELLGYPESAPIRTGAGIESGWKNILGYEGLEPPSKEAEILGGVSEFVGGGVVPGVGLVAKTPGIVPKIVTGTAEASSAALGGIGMEFGQEITEKTGVPGADIALSMAGSFSPYMASSALGTIFDRIRNFLSPSTQSEIGRSMAVAKIQQELANVPDVVAKMERSNELRSNIPGYTPTLGMTTDASSIKSLEQRFAEESQAGLEKAQKAENASLAAIEAKKSEVFPDTSGDLNKHIYTREKRIEHSIKNEQKEIEKQMKLIEDAIWSKKGDQEQLGQQLKVLRDLREQKVRAQKNMKYNDFYNTAAEEGIEVVTTPFYDQVRKIMSDRGTAFQQKSPIFNKILNEWKPKTQESVIYTGLPNIPQPYVASVEEMHSALKQIRREKRLNDPARNPNADPVVNYELGKLEKSFNDYFDAIKAQGGKTSDKLKEADSFWLNEYQKVFKEGVGGRMQSFNRYGDTTASENIVKNIVLGRASGIDDFRKIYGESDEAQRMLEGGILDLFARATMRDGTFSPSAAATFLKNNDETLKKLPALQKILSDQKTAYQAMQNRNALVTKQIKGLNQSSLKSLLKTNDPDALVDKAMLNTKDMSVLRTTAVKQDPENGLALLRHGIANNVLKQENPFEYFLKNKDTIAVGFGGKSNDHYKTLLDLAEAKSLLKNKFPTNKIHTTLSQQDGLKQRVGVSIQEAFTLMRHVKSGWISPEYAAQHIGGKTIFKIRANEMNKLMEEAFYDPETAKLLLSAVQNKSQTTLVKKGKTLLVDVGEKLKEKLFSLGARANIAINQPSTLEEE